jgi:hypothetical protein
MLKHPWWAGLAGIFTLLALVVGILQLTGSDSKPAPGDDDAGGNTATGDCIAQGAGNDVACSYKVYPPAPASIGAVKVKWAGFITFLFDGQPAQLPTPPDYPAHAAWGHCDEWGDWLSRTPGIYSMAPGVLLSLTSGQGEQVVVQRAEATVFSKEPFAGRDFTIIECQYGAGGDAGAVITVDVGTGRSELVDYDMADQTPMQMPPAAFELNGADYESAQLSIKSSAGFLYTGQIVVTALINGQERKVEFGTPSRPLRWVGGPDESLPEMPNGTRYDWNPHTHRWITNLNPEDVQTTP